MGYNATEKCLACLIHPIEYCMYCRRGICLECRNLRQLEKSRLADIARCNVADHDKYRPKGIRPCTTREKWYALDGHFY